MHVRRNANQDGVARRDCRYRAPGHPFRHAASRVAHCWASSSAPKPAARRQLEKLGRGLVAIHPETGKVFIGWRMLGTDPETISFNVYRATGGGRPIRVNATPVVDATSFTDTRADVTKANSYFLRPVLNGREQAASARFMLPANAPVRQ